jgi:hypothetical protein
MKNVVVIPQKTGAMDMVRMVKFVYGKKPGEESIVMV